MLPSDTSIVEFPIFKGLDQQSRYVQEIVWMTNKYLGGIIPDRVWHYTSWEAFKKILETNSLLLSHVSKMNDPNEFIASVSALSLILNQRLNSTGLSAREKVLYQSALEGMTEDKKASPWYAFSTSAAMDDSAQWHRYADEEMGVSIGFNPRELLGFFGRPSNDYPLMMPIEYDRQKIITFFSYIVELGVLNFERDFVQTLCDEQAVREFLDAWSPHVEHFSIVTKLPGWSSEKEWRFGKSILQNAYSAEDMVSMNGVARWKVRDGAACEDGCRQLPIKEVIIGPKSDKTVQELTNVLNDNGLWQVDVRKSTLSPWVAK